MLARFQRRRVPRWGLAVFLISFVSMLGLGSLWRLPGCFSAELLRAGLGDYGGEWGFGSLFGGLLFCLTGIDPGYLPGILEAALPVAAAGNGAAAAFSESFAENGGERSLVQEDGSAEKRAGCEVAIYHTHNSETYVPLDGRSKVEGRNGGVSLVGEEIARALGEAGIKAVHDLTIHDYPDFPKSYIKSEATARRLVKENPDLKVLIDLHRDAGLPRKETVKVGGEDVARVLIIVGNGERLSNPHWRENYAFAQLIAHRLEERYPGVLKAVRLKDGRYNQHVFPHAVLVEVGSEKNTLQECLRAGRCLAEVLVDVVEEARSSGKG
ncbi:MAG: stage II sporulation protein P [Thermacetogeniaceae bacterium]